MNNFFFGLFKYLWIFFLLSCVLCFLSVFAMCFPGLFSFISFCVLYVWNGFLSFPLFWKFMFLGFCSFVAFLISVAVWDIERHDREVRKKK